MPPVQPQLRIVLRFLEKLEIELPYNPEFPLLCMHTKEGRIQRDDSLEKTLMLGKIEHRSRRG